MKTPSDEKPSTVVSKGETDILHPASHPPGKVALPVREDNPAINRHRMLEAIMGSMDTPYSYVGSDSSGFDCSGFTKKIYADVVAISLPHSCKAQFTLGRAIELDNLVFGDLIFFDTGGDSPSHVGIYVGDGLFAHASVSTGVRLSLLNDSYYASRFVGARRIVSR